MCIGRVSSCIWRSLSAECLDTRLESEDDLLEEELVVPVLLFLLVLEPAIDAAEKDGLLGIKDSLCSLERPAQWL